MVLEILLIVYLSTLVFLLSLIKDHKIIIKILSHCKIIDAVWTHDQPYLTSDKRLRMVHKDKNGYFICGIIKETIGRLTPDGLISEPYSYIYSWKPYSIRKKFRNWIKQNAKSNYN